MSKSPRPTLRDAFSGGYDTEKLRAALAGGADPNERLGTDNTPALIHLSQRTFESRVELMEILLKAGADPDIRDNKNQTVLHHVAASSIGLDHGTKIIALMVKYKADINAADHHGNTPLHIAGDNCLRGYGPKNLQAVLEAGADITRTNKKGQTPLDAMAESKKTPEAKENIRILFNKYTSRLLTIQKEQAQDRRAHLQEIAHKKKHQFQLKKKP